MNNQTDNLQVRNNSIDLFRYLCAILVVIIHSSFWRDWGNFGIFIGDVFTRIAVPFFFATSGYFYIKKLIYGSTAFLKQLKHILLIYSVWSFVYFSLDFFNRVILDGHEILPLVKEYIISFFILGSVSHFWYFPALIISICLVTLIHKCKLMKILIPLTVTLYIVGCLGCAYYEVSKDIPFLNWLFNLEYFYAIRRIFLMGFPFFSMGYLLLKIKERYNDKINKNKSLIIAWCISAALFLAEIFLILYFEIDSTIVITFGLYVLLIFTMLILLNNPLPRYTKASKASRNIANFTYYAHPLFQTFIVGLSKFTNIKVPNIIEFVFVVFITFSLGYILHLLKERKRWKIINLILG